MLIGFDTFVEPFNVAKISYFYRKIKITLTTYIRKHIIFRIATDNALFVISPTFDLLFTWRIIIELHLLFCVVDNHALYIKQSLFSSRFAAISNIQIKSSNSTYYCSLYFIFTVSLALQDYLLFLESLNCYPKFHWLLEVKTENMFFFLFFQSQIIINAIGILKFHLKRNW